MITAIVTKLKTGPYKQVIPFGYGSLPAAPYIVVKQEQDILSRGTAFRIIAHFLPGQLVAMEAYIRNELSTLLSGFSGTTSAGNNFTLLDDYNVFPETIISNDDSTIAMERVFYTPDLMF
jgi:hypothetical protein